jgi:hypothetical protein
MDMSHRRPGPVTPVPPAEFPVYGLDSPFPGPRWLQLFGDPPDGSPTWMALNHQSAVVGIGPRTSPEDLSFGALRDASVYHFNLQNPLSFEIAEAAAEAAGGRTQRA